ncbi:MAG TPA: dTMP kinase [Thermoplasmata archaeon]|nr:dTMP kinase [Thermoplasmata archaeon]
MSPRRRRAGRLIALEGIDGAGKSTLLRALAPALRRRGFSVAVHREPVDRRLGALAQSASLSDAWTGAVYFTVDRYLGRPGLRRLLARHDFVLSDRSLFSTLAYQGSALSPRDRKRLEGLQRDATIAPDRVLLLEIAPSIAVGRVGDRRSARGPLERRRTLARVAAAYRRLARRPRWTVLDATLPRRELVRRAVAAVVGARPRRPGRRSR